jgi:hypothetical protein
MGSKGLPNHSPRSPVYGETLARYTRAIYPRRFLLTMPSWAASVFHKIWLGHISPVYGKTLARCTHAVYAPRFLVTMPS